jgi:hypothetical protein
MRRHDALAGAHRPARAVCPKVAVIRRYQQTLEVSRDGRDPLPHAALAPLLPCMEYDHKQLLYGEAARDPFTGIRHNVHVERKRLYQFDARGRLVTGAGFTDRIYTDLVARGYRVEFVERNPAPARPAAFVPRWERLEGHPEFACTLCDRASLMAVVGPIDPEDEELVALARRVKQREIMEVIVRRAQKGLGCTIKVPPGVGKSYLLAAIGLALPKARIAVTVPDKDNFHKTYRHLCRYLSGIGQVGDGKRTLGRVTVYTAGSLHHLADNDVDLLLIDEAHKYAADKTSEILATVAPYAVRVMLTATPTGRLDNADLKLHWLGGPVKYELSWPEAVNLGLVVPIEVRWIAMDGIPNPGAGLQGVWKKRHGVWRNAARNRRIADVAAALHEDDQVLIMVATIEHAVHLRRFLPGYELVYGTHDIKKFRKYADQELLAEDFRPVVGNRRDEMRRDFEAGRLKRVIATDVWSTGVSFDRLAELFRADARGSPILDEQIPGRVSRIYAAGGKRRGIVRDCLDEYDHGGSLAARGRMKNYKEKGWHQVFPAKRRGRA